MEHSVLPLTGLLKSSNEDQMVSRPSFFRLTREDDRSAIVQLLQLPGIRIADELRGQLSELIKSLHPARRLKSHELDEAARQHLNGVPLDEYGVWVFYPWLNKLVHILDQDEFRNIRTNRNQYKITPEERDILATKKIGVLGLSVGQSVAVTMAMERSFGELRIADFDTLELSNLNRIRSGIQDLGMLKTISTARQIAEIDPYLNVTIFNEGVNENNLESFLLEGGKLDLLIDECDGLDIKILARHKAKQHRIPVVMETSDRGMLDIERFDLEPQRSIMHGLIDHLDLDPEKLKGLSNEEKIPYILPMLGLDTMSDRLKASMLEIDQSITTWPQLASDVVLGGAVSANVCRRIALGQFQASGRFFVDINEIVSEKNIFQFPMPVSEIEATEPETQAERVNLKKHMSDDNQFDLEKVQAIALVKAAVTAPSGGNSQPWKFLYENKNLYLLIDKSRATSFLDFESAGAYVGLGAATENLILKAHNMGLEASMDLFPEKENPSLAAVFRFYIHESSAPGKVESHAFDFLTDALPVRLTNRLLRKRQKIDSDKKEKIMRAAQSVRSAALTLIEDDAAMESIGGLIARVDRILITHRDGHHGFIHEIRWSEEEAQRTRDGVDLATVDLSAGEAAGFRMAKNWSVVKTLNTWGGGSVFEKLSRKSVAGASAIGLITMPGPESIHYFEAGRALERLWLQANKIGVALQPMTALTFLLHRLVQGKGQALTPANIKDLSKIKEEFYRTFNLDNTRHPSFLFRLLIAGEPKVKSLRRPVEDVLLYKR